MPSDSQPSAAAMPHSSDSGTDELLNKLRGLETTFHKIDSDLHALRSEGASKSKAREVQLKTASLTESIRSLRESASLDAETAGMVQNLEVSARNLEALVIESARTEDAARRISKIESSLAQLRAVAAEIPDLAAALGVSPVEAPISIAPAAEIVKAADYKVSDVSIKPVARLGRQLDLDSAGRRVLVKSSDGATLKYAEKIGKVRIRAKSDEDGSAVSKAVFHIKATLSGGGEAVLGRGVTTKSGYASLNFADIDRGSVDELFVEFPRRDGQSDDKTLFKITDDHFLTFRDRAIPHDLRLPGSILDRLTKVKDSTGTVDDPDSKDLELAPEVYTFDTELMDGNCCIKPSPDVAARQYFFKQIVRLDAPDLVVSRDQLNRMDIRAPIDYGGESPSDYAIAGGNIVLGKAITYRQTWRPVKQGLGRLLYSLALAPCEAVNIAVIDWERSEEDSRRESTSVSEQLTADLQRDRTIDEAVESVLEEEQSGSTVEGGGGASFSLFGLFSIGGGGGASGSSTEGYRELVASTTQRLSDSVNQRSSSLRSLRSTVVTTSEQRESERVRTRSVKNHNINHAMTVQYYQVLSHFRVVTDVHEEKDILLVPYEIDEAIFDTIPSFEKFRLAPSRPITRFLLRHRRIIQRLTPRRLHSAFESLARLVYCGDVYEIETPNATATTWTVNLHKSNRTGISLAIETTDGREVALVPIGSGKTTQFRSEPIDVETIEALRITFDAEDAVESIAPGLANLPSISDLIESVVNHRLTRVSVSLRTDSSRFAPTPRKFHLSMAGVDTTLSADNPSVTVSVTPPSTDQLFEDWYSRAHRDYCTVQELVNFVQAHPMRFIRAIWMGEDPDRRAIRLDRYQFNGDPLLDQIMNRPIGVMGNYVAFPLLEGYKLMPTSTPMEEVSERFVSLPTRGVFAEVFLSCCNATEVRDATRVIDKETGCSVSAPEISPITMGSRARDTTLSPTSFPASMLQIQSPPAAPDPTGLSSAFDVLKTADIFRDLSNAENLNAFLTTVTGKAFDNVTEGQKVIGDLLKSLGSQGLAAVLGAATGNPLLGLLGALGSSGATPSLDSDSSGDTSGDGSSSGSGSLGNLVASNSPLSSLLTGQSLRSAEPSSVFDMQQLIERAVSSGALSESSGEIALANLLGGTAGTIVPASFLTSGSGSLEEPDTRICCRFAGTEANIIEPTALIYHKYGGSRLESNGQIYTCSGGFVDTGHLRDNADMTGYIATKAMSILSAGGILTLSSERATRTITFNATGTTPTKDLAIALGQRIAYQLAIWHEIVTWFSTFQKFSAFSPEDNFSNLLGTYIGALALQSDSDFESAMATEMQSTLTEMGAQSKAETEKAFEAVKHPDGASGGWWQDTLNPISSELIRRRHLDALPTVTPWLVSGLSACASVGAMTLKVPDADSNGVSLDTYYSLEFGDPTGFSSGALAATSSGASGGPITPADFPNLIAFIRAEITSSDPDGDKP